MCCTHKSSSNYEKYLEGRDNKEDNGRFARGRHVTSPPVLRPLQDRRINRGSAGRQAIRVP